MRTLKFFGLELNVSLKLNRVKRMEIDIPYWADDCYIHNSDTSKAIIIYWRGGQKYNIDLPKCIKAKEIIVSRKYTIANGVRSYTKNRKVVVDVYLW